MCGSQLLSTEACLTDGFSFASHPVLKENPSVASGLCFLNELSFRKRRKLGLETGIVPENFGMREQDTYSVTKGILGQMTALQKDLH